MGSLFPLATFDVVDDALADERLRTWGHWLGGCNRPFGRQSFGSGSLRIRVPRRYRRTEKDYAR